MRGRSSLCDRGLLAYRAKKTANGIRGFLTQEIPGSYSYGGLRARAPHTENGEDIVDINDTITCDITRTNRRQVGEN